MDAGRPASPKYVYVRGSVAPWPSRVQSSFLSLANPCTIAHDKGNTAPEVPGHEGNLEKQQPSEGKGRKSIKNKWKRNELTAESVLSPAVISTFLLFILLLEPLLLNGLKKL